MRDISFQSFSFWEEGKNNSSSADDKIQLRVELPLIVVISFVFIF